MAKIKSDIPGICNAWFTDFGCVRIAKVKCVVRIGGWVFVELLNGSIATTHEIGSGCQVYDAWQRPPDWAPLKALLYMRRITKAELARHGEAWKARERAERLLSVAGRVARDLGAVGIKLTPAQLRKLGRLRTAVFQDRKVPECLRKKAGPCETD